jgi:hypothetical protein
MRSITRVALGAATLSTLAGVSAFTLSRAADALRPAPVSRSSFSAMIRGAVTALPEGEARFGLVGGESGVSLALGVGDSEGSILFSGPAGVRLAPGTYSVSDAAAAGTARALIVTGRAERPSGSFRAESGTLTITQVSDSGVSGRFELHATGFLASDPTDETRVVTASGTFAAVR